MTRYDPLAVSLPLIAAGVAPPTQARVSRRRRLVPLAVDVDGRFAATLFLRRGVSGRPYLDCWALLRDPDGWRLLGGSSGGPVDTGARPQALDGDPCLHVVGVGTVRWRSGILPMPGAMMSTLELRAAAGVAVLGHRRRTVPVAGHGYAVIVTRRPRRLTALAGDGARLGVLDVRPPGS